MTKKGKGDKKDKKAQKAKEDVMDEKTAEALLPPEERPTISDAECLQAIKDMATEMRDMQLTEARAIAARGGALDEDNIAPGWSHPKEDEIVSEWDTWFKQFDATPSLLAHMDDYFREAGVRLEKVRAEEAAEIGQ